MNIDIIDNSIPRLRDKKRKTLISSSIKKERGNKEIGTNKIRNWGKINLHMNKKRASSENKMER